MTTFLRTLALAAVAISSGWILAATAHLWGEDPAAPSSPEVHASPSVVAPDRLAFVICVADKAGLELQCVLTEHGLGAGRSLAVVDPVERADGSVSSWQTDCCRAALEADSQQLLYGGVTCAPSGCPPDEEDDIRCRGGEL